MVRPVIIVLGPSGLEAGRRIADAIGAEFTGWPGGSDRSMSTFDSATDHIAGLFAEGRPVIGICAAGILIRAVAPALSDKTAEPPVHRGRRGWLGGGAALGGHHGANDLARRIAPRSAYAPAITTAGDLRFGVALDDPPEGWTLANPEHAKDAMARLRRRRAAAYRGRSAVAGRTRAGGKGDSTQAARHPRCFR
jgi:cobalt-precorrin 5A hydrolase / precorrin-3B C17-methyltransferase